MSDDLIHDRATIRAGWEDDDPEVTRIARRVGAALNSGRDKAVVDVVLDEVATLRAENARLERVLGVVTTIKDRKLDTLDRVRALADDLAMRADRELSGESEHGPDDRSASVIGLATARRQAADAIRRALGES